MTSETFPIEIEGVKDEDVPDKKIGRPIKTDEQNEGKEEGTAPAAHTTAPER